MINRYKYILASNSPRRKELLKGLDIEFEVKVFPNIDESYPQDLKKEEVPLYIAEKKAKAHESLLVNGEVMLITADTIVLLNDKVYGKPKTEEDAKQMLRDLSGKTHTVITGLCLTTLQKQKGLSVFTEVKFADLSENEIEYYVSKYKPLDKAGAYGIQEWIGYIAVENIIGSYFNIVGLPVQRLYQELKNF